MRLQNPKSCRTLILLYNSLHFKTMLIILLFFFGDPDPGLSIWAASLLTKEEAGKKMLINLLISLF